MTRSNLSLLSARRTRRRPARIADRTPGMGRVVILTAAVGAGHDGAAYELARRLVHEGVDVDVRDWLDALPGVGRLLARDCYGPVIQHAPRFFQWLFAGIEHRRTARATAQTQHAGTGTAVHLRDLHRTFGATRALDGLDLELHPGELVALLGTSGCGKTTALRVLAGMETIDSGEVLVDGRDITRLPVRKRDMGMVFQNYSLFPNLSALENVAFGLRVRGRPTAARRRRAAELLDMVGLADQTGKYPRQMSGGPHIIGGIGQFASLLI